MGNIEKYGVLALIFVIVLILAVAICNGPGDASKDGANPQNPNNPGASALVGMPGNPGLTKDQINQRKNIAAALEKQREEMAKNGQSGNSKASNSNPNNPNQGPNGAKGVDLNPPVAGRDEKGGIEKSPSFKTHIVQKNETLESIAKKELGARGKWTDLAKANEGLDPKKLKIGQSILVPVVEDLDLREAAESAADKSAPIKAVKKNAKENTIAAKSTR